MEAYFRFKLFIDLYLPLILLAVITLFIGGIVLSAKWDGWKKKKAREKKWKK